MQNRWASGAKRNRTLKSKTWENAPKAAGGLLAGILLACLCSGCQTVPMHPGGSRLLGAWGLDGFRAQTTTPSSPSDPKPADKPYADTLLEEDKGPGAGAYALYGLIGFPRDVVAAVIEPAGYVGGAAGGILLNVLALPVSALYSGEYKVERPVSRACVMVVAFPFFITSDIFCRSFTGDMNRYRWGVHPYPRADWRFFPNYQAILGTKE